MLNKKLILIGVLVSAIVPLLVPKFLSTETKVYNPDGSVSEIARVNTFTYLGYFVFFICIFISYILVILIWNIIINKFAKSTQEPPGE